jgi:hypothetical protein
MTRTTSTRRCAVLAVALLAASAPAQPCEPEWSPLGPGLPNDGPWTALAVFDDGSGPALYAAGGFTAEQGAPATGLARWDGQSWSSVGGGGVDGERKEVSALHVFDDGSGPALYIAGDFASVAGVPTLRAAKWDGESWSEVGGGLTSLRGLSFAVFDDGGGEALYLGGWGGPQSVVYKLAGVTWEPVGELTGWADRWSCSHVPFARALAAFDDGTGPALYAAGHFWYDGPDLYVISTARWDGNTWSEVGGPGPPGLTCAYALTVFDSGSGPALYAAGDYAPISKWDGLAWTAIGGPVSVVSMIVHDDGAGPSLYIGGSFSKPGGIDAPGIARWDGSDWFGLGAGITRAGEPGDVYAISPGWDDPSTIFAFGHFDMAGDQPAANIARWGCPARTQCTADCDASGALDLADFVCFTALFNAADPAADCDGSGGLDLFDFLCFVNALNQGC